MTYRQINILIVDDDPVLLEMLNLMLHRLPFFTVDLAENGEEGVRKVDNGQYDLILTDIVMPGMSGNDFFDYVKNNVEQSIPVIAMSGMPRLAEKSDFDAVITKPFRKEDLLHLISQFVQLPSSQ